VLESPGIAAAAAAAAAMLTMAILPIGHRRALAEPDGPQQPRVEPLLPQLGEPGVQAQQAQHHPGSLRLARRRLQLLP